METLDRALRESPLFFSSWRAYTLGGFSILLLQIHKNAAPEDCRTTGPVLPGDLSTTVWYRGNNP